MIKRLIFDVDNTLINWEAKYWNSINDTLDYFNIKYDHNLIKKLRDAVDNYEKNYEYYSKDDMRHIMEKYSNMKLPKNFVDMWIYYLGKCVPEKEDKELIKTLEYLSNKYELVVLTNWFTNQQTERLKNFKIDKYFKEIIGTEKVKNKPNKEAFLKAVGNYKIDQCIMIGDSYEYDIKGALDINLQVIQITDEKKEYKTIKNINELREIL